MAQVIRGALTSTSQIEVSWTALAGTNTGGATIDSYMIEWDAGAGAGQPFAAL
jgi:hypothetical protein